MAGEADLVGNRKPLRLGLEFRVERACAGDGRGDAATGGLQLCQGVDEEIKSFDGA